MNEDTVYVGQELELFNKAKNWKRYWGSQVRPFIGRRVLEVGAGLGGTTLSLLEQNPNIERWICVEPDPALAGQIAEKKTRTPVLSKVEVFTGLLSEYPDSEQFDTMVYIDVLEHIEDDKSELLEAVRRLESGGHLVILVPAHQSLYSEFDKAIGHYRRYDKRALSAVIPELTMVVRFRYLDSLGLAASFLNKFSLHQSYPTPEQIRFWDSLMVPISRVMDRVTVFAFGKSLVLVLKKM